MDSEPKKALISCAKDTCSGFGGELFKSLKNCGYRTKVVSDDHQAVLTTEEIQRFRIFIIVLSDHYATCQFRLDKLVEIVDKFGRTKRGRVFPVFFDVEPYDVKNQKGSFEIAFDVHKNYVNADKLKKWQEALTWVGRAHGWPFKRYSPFFVLLRNKCFLLWFDLELVQLMFVKLTYQKPCYQAPPSIKWS